MITELRHLPAPAKLNLFLHVTGRRADGYHLLETVFEMIDLDDRIHLRVRHDGVIRRSGTLPGIDPETDLTVRAAQLLARQTGCPLGVEIELEKRIPIGGGLGGGSSDAATVLMGLNRLWALGLTPAQLAPIGAQLGADVPFFIFGETAYATGVGDELSACPQPARAYVLIAPGVGVATPRVFGDPGLTRDTKPLKIDGLLRGQSVFCGRNDLEPVAARLEAKVDASILLLRDAARSVGIDPGLTRMSGSGSTVFLPVPEDHLAAAVRFLDTGNRLCKGASVHVVRSVARHPLRSWAFV
ncbi:MAG: 4-(cytidine 5'-diphospho)-2-C-methyl-D-erythritol kinase [Burkholderiaceae bacterium]